ncbi:MAG: 4-hydroxy-tetrahydrodipicolinate reductase [Bacteroidetes bacterium]|nr:4-hydroxy-tetrahydrodipicolinate reductase [Bacteroidota bacterium]MBS1628620.1 4-hydroxy-tetrahydrodipicolinate reductase [Bacteroidota bacterium]
MKIALIGYGKMGHAIERIAASRGHETVLKITSSNQEDFFEKNLRTADVAIEFTRPEAALANVLRCLDAHLPVVCGTTGWNELLPLANARANERNTAFLQASNFSIGVNIFFEINRRLAQLMQGQPSYQVHLEEVHHLQKKDKPSGTAISLAEQILKENPNIQGWALAEQAGPHQLPITALREEGVPGTHKVSWASEVDTIDITHTAHSRDGFALGAVLAAEFLIGKSGIFHMKDVLAGSGV